ncbi:hypothetical protein QYE76_052128 [Lolium multiflorum]|uniref:Uncharacterized protein n=1 Tax=Lolium multiflorum TaxID=4521 RepID=A0AAD8WIW6_LOLMU|nr:hypothetical protein QYE76_052128 [Lolium multiflorum]
MEAIAARDEEVAASARDSALYHTDLARVATEEEAAAATQRAQWDSSLLEAIERRRRDEEASVRDRLTPLSWHVACLSRTRSSRTAYKGHGARLSKPGSAPTMVSGPKVTSAKSSTPRDCE